MRTRLGIAATLVAAACWLAPSAQAADSWEPVGSPIAAGESNYGVDIASVGATPYVIWSELDGDGGLDIRSAYLSGGRWIRSAAMNADTSKSAARPKIVDAGGVPYATWAEKDENDATVIHVARMDPADHTWHLFGSTIDVYPADEPGRFFADNPDIAFFEGHIYVSFLEDNGTEYELWVARDNGEGGWDMIHAPGTIPRETSIAVSSGHLFVGYGEAPGSTVVHRLNDAGDRFVPAGQNLNGYDDQSGSPPMLADVGGVLHALWLGGDGLHVSTFDGGSWQRAGDPVAQYSSEHWPLGAAITGAGGVPYVAWLPPSGRTNVGLVVSRPATSGPAWVQVGDPLTAAKVTQGNVGEAAVDDVPYVAWSEGGTIHVARLHHDVPPPQPPLTVGDPCGKTVSGTSGPDVLVGDERRNILLGLAGDDRLFGLANGDCIDGGLGNDYIEGDGGADRLFGGSGSDFVRGGADEDLVEGGPGKDHLSGGDDDDEIHGGSGNDRIKGGNGYDKVFGGKGNDRIDATGHGLDVVDCGPGRDRVKAYREERLIRCEKIKLVD